MKRAPSAVVTYFPESLLSPQVEAQAAIACSHKCLQVLVVVSPDLQPLLFCDERGCCFCSDVLCMSLLDTEEIHTLSLRLLFHRPLYP